MGTINTRLSIVDLSNGRQPLSNEDGSVWVVLNGEDFVSHLRGEFAVALLDQRNEVLYHRLVYPSLWIEDELACNSAHG
jgi:asparagine synthetase B (glutamine-hydrolysing)